MKFIAFCTPTLGMVSIEWASALRAMTLPLNTGYSEAFGKDSVGGEIAEGRNGCVATALSYESDRREITHLFWLDDDVVAPRSALMALMRHDADIASGVYFTKGEPCEPLIFPGRGCGTTPFVPDRVFETWGHGMGLALVRTSVYKRMLAELNLPRDRYGRPAWYKTPSAEDAEIVDETLFVGGTEDLYFLHRAGQMGYRPIVDTSRYAFGWHVNSETGLGYPLKQWKQYRARQPIVWDTPDGPVTWGWPPEEAEMPDGPPACRKRLPVGDETPHAVLANGD